MKLITRPSVYLVGRQDRVDEELKRFLADHGTEWESDGGSAAEVLAETAGRICFFSFANPRPGGNAAYLSHIREVGHTSVFEHAVWNLIVTGVSRSLTHELVRHRVGLSPSQLSQRYVDEGVSEYVVPPDLRDEVAAAVSRFKFAWHNPAYDEEECDVLLGNDLTETERVGVEWIRSVSSSHRAYVMVADYLAGKALKRGLAKTEGRKFARQAARSVLPNATETKIFITVNARAARHLIDLRASRFADPEIRVAAYEIWKVLRSEAPNLFGDYREVPLPDGTVELRAGE